MNRRILVVDDYAAVAAVTATMATMEGYEARVAHTGEDALAVVEEFEPDLVVLDLMLGGGLSGEEVLDRILARHPQTRVLIVSALVNAAGSPVVAQPGRVELMAKPFKVRELSQRIAALLNSRATTAA